MFEFSIYIFSWFTSLDERRVMLGVYTIIGLSFAPNAFEYYQVISTMGNTCQLCVMIRNICASPSIFLAKLCFPTFKGRLLYIHPVGRSVGWSVG